MLAVWGGPTPHNLETLCLCYANQASSKVPISSSNPDTIRKGGETTFSFPRSSLPRCRVIITQREVLIRLGIPPNTNAVKLVRKALGDTIQTTGGAGGETPVCSSICQLDAEREIRDEPKSKKNRTWRCPTQTQNTGNLINITFLSIFYRNK